MTSIESFLLFLVGTLLVGFAIMVGGAALLEMINTMLDISQTDL